MTEVLDPVSVEKAIRETANRIAKGVRVVSQAEAEFRLRQRELDRAFAAAYLDAEGPAHEKKYRAELATVQERDTAEIAELAFRHADRLARALTEELRAWQSVNASVRAMFSGQMSGMGG